MRLLWRHSSVNDFSAKAWDEFLHRLATSSEVQSDFIYTHHVSTDQLSAGDVVEVGWQPNRHCMFRYQGNQRFVVEHAANSKLRVGDTFVCSLFILNEPLHLNSLVQDNRPAVNFVIGNKNGLTLLEVHKGRMIFKN